MAIDGYIAARTSDDSQDVLIPVYPKLHSKIQSLFQTYHSPYTNLIAELHPICTIRFRRAQRLGCFNLSSLVPHLLSFGVIKLLASVRPQCFLEYLISYIWQTFMIGEGQMSVPYHPSNIFWGTPSEPKTHD